MRGFRTILKAALAGLALLGPLPAAAADCGGLAGQYFFDVQNGPLRGPLQQRLGRSYAAFEARMQTTVPFETAGGYAFATGCRPHNCTIDEAFLGVEPRSCAVYVGLLEENRGFRFVPDLSSWPGPLRERAAAWENDR